MKSGQDIQFMRRALEIAKKGAGFVSPNPLVGCVVVGEGKIIAEGYHKKYGGPHAEIEALKKVINIEKEKRKSLTVYVTYEPCVEFEGKNTPSCAERLTEFGIGCVVIGMRDPNPKVSGRGIRKLKEAGIKTRVGILEKECNELNEVFTHWIKTKKPFVVLKMATTLDGAVTLEKGKRSNLSSPDSIRFVHELRQKYDAIGVGIGTVKIDNPLLTTRGVVHARNPIRVIFDTDLEISPRAKLLCQEGQTIIFTRRDVPHKKQTALLKYYPTVIIVPLPTTKTKRGLQLQSALGWLGEQGITSILIEGGVGLAQSFLSAGLVDRLMLTITPYVSKNFNAPKLLINFVELKPKSSYLKSTGDDVWLISNLK
jgi:diaminohydroxyphosphoribosylaminopyrimidine deaminase/5-amino-6-(5-phosphoribosylamino)uracil reductase